MKGQFVNWVPVPAFACFAAAVFMIAYGFWSGIAFVGAGTSLFSSAAV